MTAAIQDSGRPSREDFEALRPILLNHTLWCLIATVVIAGNFSGWSLAGLNASLGDTDDATRLVQVRTWLAGASWFDLRLANIGAPEGLVSHWSRLIDLPLAMLLALFGTVLSPAKAELVVRVVWPSLLLFVFLRLATRELARQFGALSAGLFVLFAITSASAMLQFMPGRIDHHNAQIVCAIGGVLVLMRALDDVRQAAIAGAILGLGLAIGYESLPLTIPALAIVALVGAFRSDVAETAANATVAFAAVLMAALCMTTSATRLTTIVCDALSANLVGASLVAAVGVTIVARHHERLGVVGRLAVLAVGGLLALGVYVVMEPACLAGPFGQVDPRVKPIWLDHVFETRPIAQFLADDPMPARLILALGGLGLAAQVLSVVRRPELRHWFLLAMVALGFVCSLWQVKFTSYGGLLAIVALSIFIASVDGVGSISAPTVRAGAFLLVSQPFAAIILAAVLPVATQDRPYPSAACTGTLNLSRLASLPPGRIASELNLGPFIAALTPHQVIAAPYHRLDKKLIEMHAMFSAAPAEAKSELRRMGATYLAACVQPARKGAYVWPAGSLRALINANVVPDFLVPVELGGPETPLRVWRVVTD
jgi:hypothetical protein